MSYFSGIWEAFLRLFRKKKRGRFFREYDGPGELEPRVYDAIRMHYAASGLPLHAVSQLRRKVRIVSGLTESGGAAEYRGGVYTFTTGTPDSYTVSHEALHDLLHGWGTYGHPETFLISGRTYNVKEFLGAKGWSP